MPFADDAYDLVFSLTEPQRVGFALRYDGPADLRLREIFFYQQGLSRD